MFKGDNGGYRIPCVSFIVTCVGSALLGTVYVNIGM